MQMGKQPDNDDLAVAKQSVAEAKKLSPKHEMVEGDSLLIFLTSTCLPARRS
jgi:hypothetical protein